jgi:acyl transferase domain-containing protein/thioesterase domain-containing protein
MGELKKEDFAYDIAIIGMSGRFPKARNIDEFWQNLQAGKECISFFSDEELLSSGVEATLISNPNYVRAKGILDDVDLFDASFFGLSPREAETIDPQQRLFLECAWEALEDSGYDSHSYDGWIGVYAGVSFSSYLIRNLLQRSLNGDSGLDSYQNFIGNDKDFISTRVSYKLNLRGPSVTIQTACSTSLVNIVLACQSLLSYQCDIALAGGVSISVPHKVGYLYQEGMILSPDGHCRAFDAKGQGIVGGEGVGVVVLKRLKDALSDGDHIRAIIKGSAVNNDGSVKVGYTAPSVDGQAEVIAMAQALAGIKAETISYVEAHGTGTPLGDPIEIAALTKAFRASTDKKRFCAIGAVKTNIGHLDAAAGVAGLIKTVLALENKQLPPSLHFEKPNPKIDFDDSPFYVNTELSEWSTVEGARRAGVSSFGFGGTNAHVIVEEAPILETSSPPRPWQLLVLSAKTETALTTATQNLVKHLENSPDLNLADTAYTLQVGRRRFSNRRMIVCQNIDDAALALDTVDPKRVYTTSDESDNRSVVFMFSGQGSQYVNMASELYRVEPTFRETIDLCSETLKPQLGCDLRGIIYAGEEWADEAARRLTQTSITQPALFVIEFALAKLLAEWGIRPQAMIGHSIGEYVAACLAGVFTLEEALELVALRGRLMQGLPKGSMLAIALSEKEVLPLVGKDLSLATVNGPSSCVVSGVDDAVNALQGELTARGISCNRLHTSHAFHSEMMEPIIPLFIEYVRKLNLRTPNIRYVSNVTGTWITDAEARDPLYWGRHLRQTVRFADGIAELLTRPDTILLEIGPGQALGTLVRRRPDKAAEQVVLTSLPHPKEQVSDVAFLLNTLGRLWLAGATIDWSGFYKNERRHRIPLPTYPFERKRFWIEPSGKLPDKGFRQESVYKKPDIADWFYVPSWKRTVPPEAITESGLTKQKHSWLVFVDQSHLGTKIVNRLKKAGSAVISVMVGKQFGQTSEDTFTVNPRVKTTYSALFRELKALNSAPDRIVHLWEVTQNIRPNKGIDNFEASQYLGLYSLLFLIQAMGETNQRDSIQLNVITNNIHELTGEEEIHPEKATVLGLCKVIPQEFPNIRCRNIDIIYPTSGNEQETMLIDQILAELTAEPPGQAVAYRGRHRWMETYDGIKFDVSLEEAPRLLRKGGVYLVTGGLGYIGLTLSKYLAKVVQAKLILLGRSEFPEKKEWKRWIEAHDINDQVSQKIIKIQELEKMGAEVVVFNADVANLEQMQGVIREIYARFGSLHGVIHAAGIVGEKSFRAIKDTDSDTCTTQFRPKIDGLIVLESVLRGRTLDFCLLTSSLSSVLGGLGFGAYSAANLFMDAFAQKYCRNSSLPWISVNWDGWQHRAETEERSAHRLSVAELAMTPEEGTEVFRYILSMKALPQVVVSTGNLQTRIAQWLTFEPTQNKEVSKEGEAGSKQTRPVISSTYVAPRNRIEQEVAEIWQETLGIEQVGICDDYFELGGDSLMAIRLLSRIVETFKIEMPLESLLEARTIEQFVEKLTKAKGSEKLSEIIGVPVKGEIGASAANLAKSEPRTSTERRLLLIWERILNTSPIGIQDSFIDLQGDSNLFDRMLAEVRREFGAFAEGLSVEALYQEPTIEALARTIDDSIKPTKTLVVGLQSRGSNPPLFLIHAGGGYVFFYRALAYRLGQDRPVYAVRAETISDGNGRPFDRSRSIAELASRYIAEIKTVQPEGPYFIGGACLGGVIAFEMAQQLRSHGEGIAGPVLLFDAFVMNNPCIPEEEVTALRDAGILPSGTLCERINKHLAHASQIGVVKGVQHISGKIVHKASWEMARANRRVTRRLQAFSSQLMGKFGPKALLPDGTPDGAELIQRRIMAEFLKTSSRLLSKYVPSVYEGSIALFKASESIDPERLWAGLARGGLAVHQMPGVHLDMMEEPAVIATAALVREYLQPDGAQTGEEAQNGDALQGHNEAIDKGQLIQLSACEYHDS